MNQFYKLCLLSHSCDSYGPKNQLEVSFHLINWNEKSIYNQLQLGIVVDLYAHVQQIQVMFQIYSH